MLSAACIAAISFPASALSPTASAHPVTEPVTPACVNVSEYYSTTTGLSGPALRAKLHDIISGHRVFSYDKAWDALKILDAADEKDPINSADVVEIYTRRHVPKVLAAAGEGWNREHLWPRSYGLLQGEPEFSDLHNLRPADINVNSARGNKVFGECSSLPDPSAVCLRPANIEAAPDTAATKLTWTPPGEVRGDIARALLYMDLRYDGHGDGSTHDLILTDNPSIERREMGMLSTLLRWHQLDPPSASERLRNDRVCTLYQRNRNPFVDHPEFVQLIWNADAAPPAAAGSTLLTAALPGAAASSDLPAPAPAVSQLMQATGPVAALAPAAPSTSPSPPESTATQVSPQTSDLSSGPRVPISGPLPAWLNELHYDNIGADEGEFVEVITRPGVNPEDITVALYNGNYGNVYKSFKLSKFAPGTKIAGFATYSLTFPSNGIQNGPADGVAIIQRTVVGEKVIQFLSYEGELVGSEGPAKGFRSLDIGVAQNDKTLKGSSLGLTGKGNDYKDFRWGVLPKATPGSVNPGQTFSL